jgi:hypothetical protein
MGDYFPGGADAAGFEDLVAAHAEDWTFVDNLATKDFGPRGFFVGHISSEMFGGILAEESKTAQRATLREQLPRMQCAPILKARAWL